jgi:hypothetical protein
VILSCNSKSIEELLTPQISPHLTLQELVNKLDNIYQPCRSSIKPYYKFEYFREITEFETYNEIYYSPDAKLFSKQRFTVNTSNPLSYGDLTDTVTSLINPLTQQIEFLCYPSLYEIIPTIPPESLTSLVEQGFTEDRATRALYYAPTVPDAVQLLSSNDQRLDQKIYRKGIQNGIQNFC